MMNFKLFMVLESLAGQIMDASTDDIELVGDPSGNYGELSYKWADASGMDKETGEIAATHKFEARFNKNSDMLLSKFLRSISSDSPDEPPGHDFWMPPNPVKIDNIWTIYFKSEAQGYSVTGKAGASAGRIYRNLLLAIKKFIEQQKPNVLTFSGASGSQDIIYDVFIRRVLGDSPGKSPQLVFFPVSKTVFLSKAFVNGLSPEDQKNVYRVIERSKSEREESVALQRDRKARTRKLRVDQP